MTGLITRVFAGLALCSATGAIAAGFAITAVPPATQQAATAQKNAAVTLLLDASAPAHRITLAAPSDGEMATLRRTNQKSGTTGAKPKALAIGIGRGVTPAAQRIALDALDWQAAPDGTRAARIEVQSTGAAGVRVALNLSSTVPGLGVRFAGSGSQVFGPVSGSEIRNAMQQLGTYWAPLVEGDVETIELDVPAGVSVKDVVATLPLVSHSVVPAAEMHKLSLKRVADIGTALPCETDLVCVTPSPALAAAANAVASITFTKPEGGLYLCSGQLLNDAASDNVPYFFTANHCIDSATAAATITTYWFFDAAACNSNTVRPDYIVQASGSRLLARSDDWDWALMRLNAAPPAGATFSAWRAEPVPPGSVLTVLHHPNGDLKKFSQGTATSYVVDGLYNGTTPATFLNMTYSQGETEGGSSGSGVLTFNGVPGAGYYEVRGGLYSGANAACPAPAGYFDVYSRMDNMLPNVREYLTAGNNPSGTVSAVEFYNAALDHYFLSTNPAEINDLDSGVHVGWVRTGLRFNAYATQVPGTSPVCRFYRSPAFGDSHFYSASPAECAATAAAHPVDWVFESPNVFYIALPDPTTGACAANARPVWRFFNNVTTNHRYTAEVKDRDDMRFDAATWTPEGYGPDAVIMCSPIGS